MNGLEPTRGAIEQTFDRWKQQFAGLGLSKTAYCERQVRWRREVRGPPSSSTLRRKKLPISREAARYANASRTHRLNARDQQHLLNMLDRLRDIDDRLRQHDDATTPTADGGEAPADWPQRFAIHFSQRPDEFTEFVMALLTADRERCGPLRSQVRLTLDYLEPKGVPKFRGRDPRTDPDVVIL